MAPLDWRPRADTPEPAGLVASGAALHAVLHTLGGRTADALAPLSAVATRDLLVVLGPAQALPWADGVRYCASAADAPGLWLPTWLAPTLPADLVHAALQQRTGHATLLLWTAPDLVLELDGARRLQPDVLGWLQRELA